MKVFSITQKSINFLVNLFQVKNNNEDIKQYIDTEYMPIDREWAYSKFKN